MWSRFFQFLVERVLQRARGVEDTTLLDLADRLLRALSNIQSLASAAIPEADRALSELATAAPLLDTLIARVRQNGAISTSEWLAMTLLADLAVQLQTRWDDYYTLVFESHAETGERVEKVRAFLSSFPFAEGLVVLAGAWGQPCADQLRDAVLSAYVTMCARHGVRGDDVIYANVVRGLALDGDFFCTAFSAGCVKMLAEHALIDLGNMTAEQTECMLLMDDYGTLPGPSWG